MDGPDMRQVGGRESSGCDNSHEYSKGPNQALIPCLAQVSLHNGVNRTKSVSTVILSGCNVILEAGPEQVELLNRACFGQPIVTAEKDKQWFQLGFEESFYMFHELKCIVILGEDKHPKNIEEIWEYMKSKRKIFPDLYKAYSHLRRKNWVVRSGSQYGVDFVVYRHHPAIVHSEYAVLVLSEGNGGANDRLRVWSDLNCSLRLCGSVAKTLLVLTIRKNGDKVASSSCLEQYSIEERTIARWRPEQCREDQMVVRTRNE